MPGSCPGDRVPLPAARSRPRRTLPGPQRSETRTAAPRSRPRDLLDELPGEVDLFLVDGVAHPGIDPLRHVRAREAKPRRAFIYPVARDVGVHVAASEKDRCAGKRAGGFPTGPGGTDEA